MHCDTVIPPKVMTIATSDSGSGAGVNADLKTIAANHCYGTSVFVALTAQNTQAVNAIYPIEPDFIAEQFHTIMQDIGTDTIKIGMLYRLPVIKIVASLLKEYPEIPVVLDPVMISQSGHQLLEANAMQALIEELFPLATLVTPNLQEAAWLMDLEQITQVEMLDVATYLAKRYKVNVLLKGGHLTGKECNDLLYLHESSQMHWFNHQKINTVNCHGTGCTLSSAIASHMAHGKLILNAVAAGVNYLQQALNHGCHTKIGQGAGPVAHLYELDEKTLA